MKKLMVFLVVSILLLIAVQCQEPGPSVPGRITLKFKIGDFEMLKNSLNLGESQIDMKAGGKDLEGELSSLIYDGWNWGEVSLPLDLENFSVSLKATLVFVDSETQFSTTVSFTFDNMRVEHWFYENEFATDTTLDEGDIAYFLLDLNEGKVLVVEDPVRIYGSVEKKGDIVDMDTGDRSLKAVGDIFGRFQFWVPRPYIGRYDVWLWYNNSSTEVTVAGESGEIEVSF
ncbi:MAG: hypothetical protein DRP24_03830 [Thermotoga sp.]|nr:MAG: hypothetical protein DRP24_03830 [Thermotoga sp.]